MKQYVVDQLRFNDYEKLRGCLDQRFGPASIEGVYWVALEPGRLSATQAAHRGCQPFFAALELCGERLSVELLIRTRQRIRCDCIAYANEEQRNWLIRLVDDLMQQLGISV
ncbi:MAG: hypothetical protein MUD16_02550 [Desulfobacterales bacterium]|jgi:hypothetical protein|nr:hypothetical protein [Desulfobacterales bacterium]